MHWNLFTNKLCVSFSSTFSCAIVINNFYSVFRGYACPICNKSLINMTRMWRTLDLELSHTAMPEEYREFYVLVRCFC